MPAFILKTPLFSIIEQEKKYHVIDYLSNNLFLKK